jgi:hypothetical protein
VLPGRELALTFASLRATISSGTMSSTTTSRAGSRGVRPAVLERRQHQPARRNVRLLPAQHVPREQPENTGPAYDVRGAGGPGHRGHARLRPGHAEDHIVPWRTAYASMRLLKGRIRFVLAASGHIAGVINPASKNRRNYWLNDVQEDDPERWLADAASQREAGGRTGATGLRLSAGSGRRAGRAGRERLPGDRSGPGTLRQEKCTCLRAPIKMRVGALIRGA